VRLQWFADQMRFATVGAPRHAPEPEQAAAF
jgi:hypothetical protein